MRDSVEKKAPLEEPNGRRAAPNGSEARPAQRKSASVGSVDEELLLAYLQGRLADDERSQVERIIDEHPDYRRLAAALVELSVAESGSRRALPESGEASGTRPGAGAFEAMDFAPGTLFAGKYRVGAEIGMGAMGLVLEAEHLHLGETRAIKVLRSKERGAESVARFVREARAAMSLDSEHVARVFDMGALEDGRLYLVMERLHGENLRSFAKREGPLDAQRAARLTLQAARGVAAAHRRGVIHRDLKPANLFVVDGGSAEAEFVRVKILDFGLAKTQPKPDADSREHSLTTESSILGSPMYMSPEQIRDARKVDARTDLWSVGVILHELLAGAPPFRAKTVGGLLASIVADDPTPLPAGVPRPLAAIVEACLQKDPAKRLSSAGELASRLEAFLSGEEPVAASARSPRRGPAVAIALVAAAVVLGVWWSTRPVPVAPLRAVAGSVDTRTPLANAAAKVQPTVPAREEEAAPPPETAPERNSRPKSTVPPKRLVPTPGPSC